MSAGDEKKTEELISLGAEIAGTAAGGALGFVAAGPVGAAAGSVGGLLLTKALETAADFALRSLSRREKTRVGAGLAFAFAKVAQYLEEGRVPRDDGFFDRDPTGRSMNDELLEGVLFKCRNEHEERKTRFIGNIYANVAFMTEVSAAGANWLLQKAEELTYRQMCILAIAEQKEHKNPSWGPNDGDPAFQLEHDQLIELLAFNESLEDYYRGHQTKTGELSRIIGLNRVGRFVYTVMGLDEIPEEHLRELAPWFPRAFDSSTPLRRTP